MPAVLHLTASPTVYPPCGTGPPKHRRAREDSDAAMRPWPHWGLQSGAEAPPYILPTDAQPTAVGTETNAGWSMTNRSYTPAGALQRFAVGSCLVLRTALSPTPLMDLPEGPAPQSKVPRPCLARSETTKPLLLGALCASCASWRPALALQGHLLSSVCAQWKAPVQGRRETGFLHVNGLPVTSRGDGGGEGALPLSKRTCLTHWSSAGDPRQGSALGGEREATGECGKPLNKMVHDGWESGWGAEAAVAEPLRLELELQGSGWGVTDSYLRSPPPPGTDVGVGVGAILRP